MTQPDADPTVNQSASDSAPSSESKADPSPESAPAIADAQSSSAPDDTAQNPEPIEDNRPKYTGPQPILSTNEPVLSPALNRYECKSCGYIYEPQLGDSRSQISKNTAFVDVPITWRCAVCGCKKSLFVNIGPGGQPSGFEENLGYGMGVNTLSPAAKNLLIFGSLGAALALMLSLYGLR